MTKEAAKIFSASYNPPEEIWLAVHFSPSASSQAAGREFLKRKHLRIQNRDPEVNDKVGPAQIAALSRYSVGHEGKYEYLKQIKQPTLVVNGQNDVIVPSVNSFHLQQNLPNAQLILYPDSNHGSQYQYPSLFVDHVNQFLSRDLQKPASTAARLPFPSLFPGQGVAA
jgi:pimeloyl-ACP methyl ester carboxylesterase